MLLQPPPNRFLAGRLVLGWTVHGWRRVEFQYVSYEKIPLLLLFWASITIAMVARFLRRPYTCSSPFVEKKVSIQIISTGTHEDGRCRNHSTTSTYLARPCTVAPPWVAKSNFPPTRLSSTQNTDKTRRRRKPNSSKPFASKMKSRALLIPVPRIGPALFSYSRRI